MTDDPLADLDFEADEPDVIDVTKLSDIQLAELRGDIRRELYESKQMMAKPANRTDRGKELHSTWTAIQIEFRKRANRRNS